MTSRSPEYEQEVVRTLRLVRGLIYSAMVLLGAILLLGLLGLVFGLASGSRISHSQGGDVHAPLRANSSLANTTESGLSAAVTILTVQRDSHLTVTARARGMGAAVALPQTWKLYFTDNTQQPMPVDVLETSKDGTTIRASLEIPAGKVLQFLHVDPDASHGDLYFDIPPG